jgi:hypothetical protein
MSETISLKLTQELNDILDKRDWSLLEEFIVIHGYDEFDHEKMEYKDV